MNDKSYISFVANKAKDPKNFDVSEMHNDLSVISERKNALKNTLASNPICSNQLVGNNIDSQASNIDSTPKDVEKELRLKKAKQKQQEFDMKRKRSTDTSATPSNVTTSPTGRSKIPKMDKENLDDSFFGEDGTDFWDNMTQRMTSTTASPSGRSKPPKSRVTPKRNSTMSPKTSKAVKK